MITHKVNTTLPLEREHNAKYLVRRDMSGTDIIDEYHTNRIPTSTGTLSINTPTTNPDAVGTVGIDMERAQILLETDGAAPDTKGTYVTIPINASGATVWTLRLKRHATGTWPTDDHTTADFIITLSPTGAGSLTHASGAGEYQQTQEDGSLSIHFSKDDLTSVVVKERTLGVTSIVPTTQSNSMLPYIGEDFIDIIVNNDAGDMGLVILMAGGERVSIDSAVDSVPYFTSGSVDFHLHSLGNVGIELLTDLTIYKANMAVETYRADASALASLI